MTSRMGWRKVTQLVGIGLLTAMSLVQPQGIAAADSPAVLPVSKIVLYASGVGYFQRDGHVESNESLSLRFKVRDINDLLKSLVVQDFDGGQVSAVTYDSREPITTALKSFAIDLTANPTLGQLLQQLRGEAVEVITPNTVRGVIVGVEKKRERVGKDEVVETEYLTLHTRDGLRAIALPQVQRLVLTEERLNTELQRALGVLAAGHDTQKKTVILDFAGSGRRQVRVAYITETPVWKTSYRLVLSDTESPFLQGWAIVENTTDEDWQAVQLSLVSGRPVSFAMDMYTPLYVERPVVVPDLYASLRPPEYAQGLDAEEKAIRGRRAQLEADDQEQERRRSRKLSRAEVMPRAMGLASPPAAPGDQLELQSTVSSARGEELGELFEYVITALVSLARQKSAMLPIVNQSVAGSKLSIYNQQVYAKHPLSGFRLHNETDLYLMQGPVTVFDADVYAGDARLADLAPGQERLISYAMDLKTEVEPVSAAGQRELVTASLRKGVLVVTRRATSEISYRVRNRDQRAKTVVIEHPFRPEWKLTEPQAATERTREVYRFALSVEPNAGKTLIVREEQPR
ncbi:MAG: DUF4139 domain-containing protein, partial [Candidatus Tectomicrobia bacterium]|nr:DUF4139 domain-containing protein [Candidatus Tectomicrobia bacterium]